MIKMKENKMGLPVKKHVKTKHVAAGSTNPDKAFKEVKKKKMSKKAKKGMY